ncbi:MAG: leucine-rich repeat protein [Clostridia bacterium]|nr:leucine-rich repeat protein [Clostridia bacterium]
MKDDKKTEQNQSFVEKLKSMNKWFYVFLATAVIALGVTIALIIVAANNGPDEPDTNDWSEGEETGVYYYNTATGEYILTLNSGNKFTIAGTDFNKSGEYTVNGSEITLDFLKDEDGTATLTAANGVFTMQYNNTEMRFLKKIPYTVNFATNGGNAITAATVINGMTVNKPADPIKENSVFMGWYKDEALTELFNFAATAITADTTIYAKWADKVTGQAEYIVDFDLGYDGATLEAVPTVGGKLHGIAAPTRDGYTFGGWWISMYEDGEKLSYEYTDDTVFTANTTLYAVWNATEGSKLAAPAVNVSSTAITWNTVSGAGIYSVKISDANGAVLFNENVGTTNKPFDFNDYPAGDYVIEVTAVATVAENTSDTTVRYYKNKALDRVSLFTVVNDGILIWNNVDGAEKYLVTVKCGDAGHEHTLFDNGTSTSFFFANCPMKKGGIEFTVTATANGRAASVSETFVYNKALDKIGAIAFDTATETFSWDAVANAASYLVTLTCGEHTHTVVDNGTSTTFCVKNCTGDIKISVFPATVGYNSPEATEATFNKTVLATPDNLKIDGMTLSWNEVANATSYEIKVGNVTLTSDTNSLGLNNAALTWATGIEYSISVKAIGTSSSSMYSDTLVAGYLTMFDNLTFAGNTLTWTPVIGVTNFEVSVNGTTKRVSGTNSAKVTLNRAGKNTVSVRYTGAGTSDWVSIEVYAYTVTYDSRSLNGTVGTDYVAIGGELTLPSTGFSVEGYNFAGWYNAPGAQSGNGLQYTSTTFAGNGDIVLYANWSPKTYNVQFYTDDTISNVPNESTAPATYTKDYTLPVPVSSDESRGSFVGWFTLPGGAGVQLTDAEGNSVAPYPYTRDTVAYPFFDTGVLTYDLQKDGTYAVKKGPNVNNFNNITVPVTYKGIAVTAIVENAFSSCYNLETIRIPDTIQLIGVGAFNSATNLKSITIYETEGNHERKYQSTDNGAVIREDMGTTYLEIVPRGITDTFTIPDDVTSILSRVFYNTKITGLIVGKGVANISESAFVGVSGLKTIEFAAGGTSPLTIEAGAFDGKTSAVETLKLPARLAEMDLTIFDNFPNLRVLEVEENGTNYSSVNNMICNAAGNKILYAPKTVTGDIEFHVKITDIGDGAFRNRTGITSVTIPNYINSIGKNAFEGCTGITSVTVNGARNNNLMIGNYAFAGCKINTVTFGATVAKAIEADKGAITIGTGAFEGIETLKTVVFKAGVNIASIGSNAFANNEGLTTIEFEDGAKITSIGSGAFSYCPKITSVLIPVSCESVGEGAFRGCENVSSVTIEEGGEVEIGDYAFEGCRKLTEVTIPASVTVFPSSAFAGCIALKKINVDKDNPALSTDDNGVVYDKEKTTILFYSSAQDGDLSKLPWDTITTIGNNVFQENINIKSVVIGAKVTKIGNYAFDKCYYLETVTFAQGGTALEVGNNAFSNCPELESVVLPAYTTKIGNSAFELSGITSFVIPEAVTSIGSKAFRATAIKSINIPANVESIGDGAFSNCVGLTTVTFSEGDKALALGTASNTTASNGIFYGTAISEITFADRITIIGGRTFSGVTTLVKATFSNTSNLTEIGKYAFHGTGLTEINLGAKLKTIHQYAFQDAKLVSVTIPKSVKLIDSYAFSFSSGNKNNATLKNVIFEMGGDKEEGLEIKANAFAYSKIETITFPNRASKLYATTTSYGATIKKFYELFNNVTTLREINVEAGGKYFASIDGVLYEVNAEGVIDVLLYCPTAKTGEITVPNTVTKVENAAFYKSSLSKVTFEEFDKNDERYGQQILHIGAGSGKSNLSSIYSVFGYTTRLVEVNLPSHLAVIGPSAFYVTNGYTETFEPDGNGNVKDPVFHELKINFNKDASKLVIRGYAFDNAKGIVTLDLPAIETIGTYAFRGCERLQTITFDEASVFTSITNYMFSGCKALTAIKIPETVTTIGNYAFTDCNSLATIEFAEDCKVTSIGDSAFQRTGLTYFKYPESVTNYNDTHFYGCLSLKTVELNSTIASIAGRRNDRNILSYCGSIEQIIVPETNPNFVSVDGVLYDKAKTIIYFYPPQKDPTGYTIPETVKEIYLMAFAYYSFNEITLPEGLEKIGSHAFYCSQLKSIYIPASVTSIGERAFRGGYSSEPSRAALESVLETVVFAPGSELTSIGEYAFGDNPVLKSIVFPDNVSTLGKYVLSECDNLESVTLPAALETLPQYCFRQCTKLKTVVLQEGLTTIDNYVFYAGSSTAVSNNAMTEITIPSTVTKIGDQAFSMCVGLESVIFTEGSQLTTIGSKAFYGAGLNGIALPTNVTSLGNQAFQNCDKLEEMDLSATKLTSIGDNAFTGCTSLESVKLPATLTTIGKRAFSQTSAYSTKGACTALESITIPASVTTIGEMAFAGCTSLTTVVFEEGSKFTAFSSKEIFRDTPALETVTLPENLNTIGTNTFKNSGLTSIALPATLTSIGTSAFENCDRLVNVSVPSSVKTIGDKAFYDADALVSVDMTFGLESIGQFALSECDSLEIVYIPATVKDLNGNPLVGSNNVEVFELDPDNGSYIVSDGVMYDSTMFTIIYYPSSLTAETFTFPETVYDIAPGAFADSQLKSIVIPSVITKIPDAAFKGSKKLESVTFERTLSSIGNSAFQDCTSLNNVFINNTTKVLGDYAFAGCTSLSNFTFEDIREGDNPYKIGTHFFEGCTSITTLLLPNSFTVSDEEYDNWYCDFEGSTPIPSYMFAGTGVVDLVIPAYIDNLYSAGVFKDCANLRSIVFEAEEVTGYQLGHYYFYGCSSLEEITVPGGHWDNWSGNYMFAHCTNLRKVTLIASGSEFYFGTGTFQNCPNLEEVYVVYDRYGEYVPASVYSLESNVIEGCTSLRVFPFEDISDIYANCMAGCTFDVVDFSENYIYTVDAYAFAGAEVREMHFGELGDTIGANAFDGWTADQTIYFHNYTEAEMLETHGTDWLINCEATIYYMDTMPADAE